MKITLQRQTIKKLVGVIAAGAFAFVPAMGIISAQADPPRHAPAYGRRDKDRKGNYNRKDRHHKNNKDRYDRNDNKGRYDGNNRYDRRNQNQTITGVVTQNYRGSQFNLRMSNGRTIRVNANRNAPGNLSSGDRVRVYGRYINNAFSASNVSVISRNRNDNRNNRDRYDRNRNNDYRSYTGVVINIRSNRAFDIRADGRIYNVTLSSNAPRGLGRNDQVRVYGKRMGENNINNANVSVLRKR